MEAKTLKMAAFAVLAMAGVAVAGAAPAGQSPAPAHRAYDPSKDPCGPVITTYCTEALAKMDHPAIHACLMAHVDLLPNSCRSTMMPPRPPLRAEDAKGNPIPTPPN
jgi:hypothetical protein